MVQQNKQECFSMQTFFRIDKCLRVMSNDLQTAKRIWATPLMFAQAVPKNIRPALNKLPETNALTYLAAASINFL